MKPQTIRQREALAKVDGRREFPAKVMVAAFKRAAGRCEKCTARLHVGKFAYDHIIPDQLGGEPTLENCQVICTACHSVKTRTKDVPAIAKAKRQERGRLGIKKPSTFRRPPPGYEYNWQARRYIRLEKPA